MNPKFFKHFFLFFMLMVSFISSTLSAAAGESGSGVSHVVFSAILYDSDAVYNADVDLGTWLTSYSIWV